MKARSSVGRHSLKYISPAISSKRFISRVCLEDQENIAPREENALSAKRRKLYNGVAVGLAVVPSTEEVAEPVPKPVESAAKNMDMDISEVLSPKRLEPQTTSAFFTPPASTVKTPRNDLFCFSTPRMSYARPKATIQEVFRNVVVYVEVKTIEEDRSDGIKRVAAEMGATVNDKLYKNTTHVIFREGSMTTYKKALKWEIPLVSVTWLEACRKTLSLVDPADFLPINLEPYERPDLYKRVRKAIPTNGEVTTTPERFALKPMRPEDEFEKALLEFQQTRQRFEQDSPVASQLGKTALNFSPIGESTKIGTPTQKTPRAQSNVTPMLRRLMIRNAEEDRRERNNIITGRSGSKPLPALDHTKYDRMSMDLSSMWGTDDPQQTNNSICSMVEETVNLTSCSPNDPALKKAPTPNDKRQTTSSIIQAIRRQTMIFTQNAGLDISPLAAKENVEAVANMPVTNHDPEEDADDSVILVEADTSASDSFVKVPKICAVQRKSVDEDTLRNDIVRAKEELLTKAVVINKSDRRRSLFPVSAAAPSGNSSTTEAATKAPVPNTNTNRRRTLFNVNAISEGGLNTPEAKKGVAKVAAKRKTLVPSSTNGKAPLAAPPTISSSSTGGMGSPNVIAKKKTKKTSTTAAASVPTFSTSKQSLTGPSQVQRKGTNMGPPKGIPPLAKGKNKDTAIEEAPIKRKLFNAVAELSPVKSPSVIRTKMLSKPFSPHTVQDIKERALEEGTAKKTIKKVRRSSVDFQDSTGSLSNASTSSSTRGTMGFKAGGVGAVKNVIVLTNGQGKHLEYMKELVGRLSGNFVVEQKVTSRTTHLVCYEKKRNMNMLRSLIRGIWVLDYDWVLKSDVLGKWQREEDYQVSTFGNTLTRVRSERQAFGSNYKMELFSGTGQYFVYDTSTVPAHHLKELLMMCGGIVVDTVDKAKYRIGDKARLHEQVISPSWVFDCICQYAFLNHKKYLKK